MGKTKISVVGEEPQPKPKKEAKKKSLKKEKGVRVPGLKGGERVVAVGMELSPEEGKEVEKVEEVEKVVKAKKPKQHGKKYLAARTKVDPQKLYSPQEAAGLVKETSISRFDGSVELHLVLTKGGLGTSVELPYSTGKTRKVEVASDETLTKLKEGKIDFDVLLATPAMMPKLVPYAKLLGPRGLLPSPKQGTLVDDPEKARARFGGNTIQIRTEKNAPLAHLVVGKTTQPDEEITANLQAVFQAVGPWLIKKAVISASMGPGIKLAIG